MRDDDVVQPTVRRYGLQLLFREGDPILVDRERLERRMTEKLIDHMRRDGVEMVKETRLPGFAMHRHGKDVPAGHVLARIECEVAQMPPIRWPRG